MAHEITNNELELKTKKPWHGFHAGPEYPRSLSEILRQIPGTSVLAESDDNEIDDFDDSTDDLGQTDV